MTRSRNSAAILRVRRPALTIGPAVLAAALAIAACSPAAPASAPAATTGGGANAPTPAAQRSAAASAPAPSMAGGASAAPMTVVQPIPKGPALKTLWVGQGPKPSAPGYWQPAIDPSGKIWMAASNDSIFWIFDRDGRYLESWGKAGDGPSEFDLVTGAGGGHGGIAFAADGGFYVADADHARIVQFDKDRNFVRSWGSFGTEDGQFGTTLNVYVDSHGDVYVIDDTRNVVQQFDSTGKFIKVVAEDTGPYLALDKDRNVYVIDENTRILTKIAPDGTRTAVADLSKVAEFVTGMAFGPSGNLFLTTATTSPTDPSYVDLLELDPTGKLVHAWPDGGEAFAIDPKGDRIYLIGRVDGLGALELPTP